MKSSLIKGVVFDLDYTLFDENDYVEAVLRCFCRDNNCMAKLDEFVDRFWRLRGESKDIFFDLLAPSGFREKVQDAKDRLFDLFISCDAPITLYPDAQNFLDFLKKKDVSLGLLTNGVVAAQRNKVRKLGIETLFDSVIYAREYGKKNEKPNAVAFKEIISRLGHHGHLKLQIFVTSI